MTVDVPQWDARRGSARPWPYTVRLPYGRRDHRARQRTDGTFETACTEGGTFPAGAGHLVRPLCYRPCPGCTHATAAR
ncbi:hypothetical protein [Streptomyces goshikiensis]